MSKKRVMLCIIFPAVFVAVFSVASASESAVGLSPTKLINPHLPEGEELPNSAEVISNLSASRSPGTQIGDTYYDMQSVGSIGRRVVFTHEDPHDLFCGTHFIWMCLPCTGGSRHIRYSARGCDNNWAYPIGPGGGISVSDANGGYGSIDVTHRGAAVIAYYSRVIPDPNTSKVCVDGSPPTAGFVCGENPGPPNCEGWFTGSNETWSTYVWPMVEADVCGGDTVFHKVTTEMPWDAPAGEIQTVVYYRDVWNHDAQTVDPPACGMAVDSVYSISAVVRQDPMSDEVAIAWPHPIHYDGDPNDPCGYYWYQNDVYVWKSTDCGDTWNRGEIINVTDYTQGGTIPITQCAGLAYCDLSALYDHSGVLHVVWNTPLRDLSGNPCNPLFANKMWHWDDSPTGTITMVYDASTPRFMWSTGSWSSSICKMNISECDGKLYCSFTRFGFHTTPDGDTSVDASVGRYENGDIGLVASSDGGKSWSQAVNVTNTITDFCEPGDCESEHWSTMAKYSTGSLHIEYIEDKDAGAYPMYEGEMTCNPVRYLAYECFTPEGYCDIDYSPTSVDSPPFISPDGQSGCSYDYTTSFDLVITNTGNEATTYSVSSTESWLTPGYTEQTLGAAEYSTIPYTIGPIADEGIYCASLIITACGGAFSNTVEVCTRVSCAPVVDLCPYSESSAITTGDLLEGTKVRHRFRIYQSAFNPEANSISFNVSQKESWIFINGWEVAICGFDNATSTRIDAHTVSVSASGGTIAYNDYVEADVTLYLTSWNTVRVSDVLWGNTLRSDNGHTITETVKACPDFGWVIEDPAPKDGDVIEHSIILYNDDETETFAFTDIGLLLSDEYIDIVSEVPEYPDSLESDTLGPGESMTDTLTEVDCTVGDADGSGEVDIDDVVFLISYIFSGGPAPSPYGSGDADCSGAVDIDDVVYLIAYIFSGGDAPGQTCNCYGPERRARGLGHIYGTFKIENGRGNVVVINWIDHPTD